MTLGPPHGRRDGGGVERKSQGHKAVAAGPRGELGGAILGLG